MSETREAYKVTATPKALFTDAESIRQKLTELIPLVDWRVDGVADSFWIVGSVVISGQVFNIGYSLLVSEYYHIREYRGWQGLSMRLVHTLADMILAWRPEENSPLQKR